MASNPARQCPQWVEMATAANTGANGVGEKNGHVTHVSTMPAPAVRTARK